MPGMWGGQPRTRGRMLYVRSEASTLAASRIVRGRDSLGSSPAELDKVRLPLDLGDPLIQCSKAGR